MSNDKFESARYKANDTKVFPTRAQPETKQLTLNGVANAYPTESVTSGLPSVKLSATSREFGVITRKVTVKLTADGTGAQSGYKEGTTHTVTWFDLDTFSGVAKDQTGTYLGIACIVIGTRGEDIN